MDLPPPSKVVHAKKILFKCETCAYETQAKRDFNKHLSTAKHRLLNDTADKKSQSSPMTKRVYKCPECENQYSHRQSLYNHRLHPCKTATTTTTTTHETVTVSTDDFKALLVQNAELLQLVKTLTQVPQQVPQQVANITNNNIVSI